MMTKVAKWVVILGSIAVACFVFCEAHYEVPVLMYHNVGRSEDASNNHVTAETFERQMEFLKVHRYRVMPLADLMDLIKSGEKIPANTVAITFDDGYLDNFENAFPILKKMGFKATIFMITRNIGEEEFLSEEDLKILDGAGITIGSHTVNHAYLPEMKLEDVLFELKQSRNRLEKILGHPVFLFSYPAGGFTEEIRSLVAQEGYQGAVTTYRGRRKHDPYALKRIKVTEAGGSLFNFWAKTSGLYYLGKSEKKPA